MMIILECLGIYVALLAIVILTSIAVDIFRRVFHV